MKKLIIILGIFLTFCSFGYEKVYLQKTVNPSYYQNRVYSPVYNPYQYYSPYNYRRINTTNVRRLNKLQRLRRLNRRLNPWYNFLTWNKKNDNGDMTGYSVPVSKDIYDEMGISPYDPKSKQKTNSPNCNTDLFSSPSGNEMYYQNGEKRVNLGGASGKTGVTIIYD